MASTKSSSALSGSVLMAAGALLVLIAWLAVSLQLKMWTDEGQPGPGFWPTTLSVLGITLASIVLSQELRAARKTIAQPAAESVVPESQATDADDGDSGVYEDHGKGALWRPLGVLAGLVAFVLLMPVLGFHIGLAAFLLYTCLVLIRMPLMQSLVIVAVLAVIVYGIFGWFFAVPFPTGILGV
jgi:hypothetical protein